MNTIAIPGVSPLVLVLLVIWTIPWKGVALWKASRLSHKWWFVVLLIVNTVGILEIIYIFLIARKYTVETERPDADVAEPLRESSEMERGVGVSMPHASDNIGTATTTSISQTVKTTEVKTVMTQPEKESPKTEIKKERTPETKEVKSEISPEK
jgi:methionyl-tRNA synthetase